MIVRQFVKLTLVGSLLGAAAYLGAPASADRSAEKSISATASEPAQRLGSVVILMDPQMISENFVEFSDDFSSESGDFILDTDPSTFPPRSRTFTGLKAGRYTIRASSTEWWRTVGSITCEDARPNGTRSRANPATGTAVINLDQGETVTCTFGNIQPGRPIVDGRPRTPVAWDNFQRSDRDVQTGDAAPSRHLWNVNGERQFIRDNRFVSEALPRRASIAYLPMDQPPTVIAAEFVFRDVDGVTAPSYAENAVIGTSEQGFGGGSVQLGVWRDRWWLFVVQKPIIDPYPRLAVGLFDTVLQADTPYRMALIWDQSTSSLKVQAPDGSETLVTHPYINEYWGRRFGIQMRRPTLADPSVEFMNAVALSD